MCVGGPDGTFGRFHCAGAERPREGGVGVGV